MLADTLTSPGLRTLCLRGATPELEPKEWLQSPRGWRHLACTRNLGVGCGECTTQGPERKNAGEERARLRRVSLNGFSKHGHIWVPTVTFQNTEAKSLKMSWEFTDST